jgi:hypothetical protein
MTYRTGRQRGCAQYTPQHEITDDHHSDHCRNRALAMRLRENNAIRVVEYSNVCCRPGDASYPRVGTSDADHVPLRRARASLGGTVVGRGAGTLSGRGKAAAISRSHPSSCCTFGSSR